MDFAETGQCPCVLPIVIDDKSITVQCWLQYGHHSAHQFAGESDHFLYCVEWRAKETVVPVVQTSKHKVK